MEAEEIKERLMHHPDVLVMKAEYGGGWTISGQGVDSFFTAIAQLCEERCGEARLADGRIQGKQATEQLRALQAQHEAELAAAQAQVAVMAEAMTDVIECRGRGDAWAGERLRQALSAAPKVLHSEKAKWDTEYLIWPVVRLQRAPIMDYRGPDDVMPGVTFMGHDPRRYEEFPGKEAYIIVLDQAEGKE